MEITLAANRLRVTWEPCKWHAEIVRRIKTVNDAEFDGKCWYAPLSEFDRLLELFPKAAISYEALAAADRHAAGRYERFRDNLARMGIELRMEGGRVVAVGIDRGGLSGVSPALQELVDERADGLWPLLNEAGQDAEPVQAALFDSNQWQKRGGY